MAIRENYGGMWDAGSEATVRIACIEGDAGLREMLCIVLGEAGYAVMLVPALSGAHAFIRRERPDILHTELWLGGALAGLQLVEELRGDPETASLPVIACSADVRLLDRHGRALRALDCRILE